MGQKTHPLGFRLGVIKTWRSRWYAGKNYAEMLHEDLRLRRYIKERLHHSGVSRIEIERKADQIRIIIHTARPGIDPPDAGRHPTAVRWRARHPLH